MKAWAKIAIGVGAFVVADIFIFDIYRQNECLVKWLDAQNYCSSIGKPLLNIGCGNNPLFVGDVNVDIGQSILPNSVVHDLNLPLPYADKQFGACVAFHVLEHLNDPKSVLSEMSRVADRTYVAVPSYFDISGLIHPDHKWLFANANVYSLDTPKALFGSALVMAIGGCLIYHSVKKKR